MNIAIVTASADDITAIERLKRSELTYPPDPSAETMSYLDRYPAFLAQDNDDVGGFIYSRDFSKDILELCNILVRREWRSVGVGSLLVTQLEARASELGYAAIILSNSLLYGGHEKRSAVPFYTKLGYSAIQQTDHSTVMFKRLA